MKCISILTAVLIVFSGYLKAGNSSVNALIIDPSGNILTAGTANSPSNSTTTQTLNKTDFALARYLSSGALDTTFNQTGTVPGVLQIDISEQTSTLGGNLEAVNEGLTSVALTSNNEIIAAGFYTVGLNANVAVLKLTSNGSLDTTFNANGLLGTTPGLAIIDVGEYIIPNNVVNGVTQDMAAGVALDSQGRIVVVGSTNNGQSTSALVIRLTPNGELDQTFNAVSSSPGIFTYSVVQNNITSNLTASAVALNPDDSILVGGTINGIYNNNSVVSSNFFILKLTPAGIVDTTFNPQTSTSQSTTPGFVQQTFQSLFNQAFALTLDADLNILIAGSSQQFFGGSNTSTGGALTLFALARFAPDGVLDTTFNASGLSMGQPGTVLTSISQHSDIINSIAITPDAKIVVTGVSNDGTNKSFATARYNNNGTLDTATFNPAGSMPGVVVTQVPPTSTNVYNSTPAVANSGNAVAIGSGNQIYVGGFSFDGNQTNFTVLDYLVTGALNSTVFNPNGLVSTIPGIVVTPIGQSLTILGNGVPIFITEDVSRVQPAILETLRHPFEPSEPVITTDTRGISRQSRVMLAGYASPNSSVLLLVNGTQAVTTTAHYMGAWQVTLPPLHDGTYRITAIARDPLSGITLASLPVSLTIKAKAPKAPLIESPLSEDVFDIPHISIEGQAEPGSLVRVTLDGRELGRSTTTEEGTWSMSAQNLVDGTHTITAQAVTEDGLTGPISSPVSFSVDLSGEEEPVIVSPENGFEVSDSELLVEGEGVPNSLVKLYANNKLVKEVPVDKDGQWSYHMKNLEGAYELYATSAVKGYESERIKGSLIMQDPPQNISARESADLFNGYAHPGGTIDVYANNKLLGSTIADRQGKWGYTPRDITRLTGKQPMKVVIADAEGTRRSMVEKDVLLP